MPKVTLCKVQRKPAVPVKRDHLRNLFDDAKRQRKMTYEEVAEKSGENGASLRTMKCNGFGNQRLEKVFKIFVAMEVDPELFGKVMEEAYRQYAEKEER